MKYVFWAVFLLLALNVVLWGGLALDAPFDKVMGAPRLVVFVFIAHMAAYLGWLYFKFARQPVTDMA